MNRLIYYSNVLYFFLSQGTNPNAYTVNTPPKVLTANSVQCPICEKMYSSADYLAKHMNIHTGMFCYTNKIHF